MYVELCLSCIEYWYVYEKSCQNCASAGIKEMTNLHIISKLSL